MIIEYKSRAWLIMQFLKEGGAQPRRALADTEDKDGNKAIGDLLRAKFIITLPDGDITLTAVGTRRLRAANLKDNGLGIVGKRTISTGTTVGKYDGRELRQTCLRAGAYDAFKLPSLIGDERHYRREIAA